MSEKTPRDPKIAGVIGTSEGAPSELLPKVEGAKGQNLTPEQLQAKIAKWRTGMFVTKEGLFDNAAQQVLFRAAHPTLVGEEIVVAVDLTAMLFTLASLIPVHIIPILAGQITISKKGKIVDTPAAD